MKHAALILTLLAVVATACGSGSDPTPRRHAYPRIEQIPQEYAPVEGAALHVEANSRAEATLDSAGRWLTLRYAPYDADIYLTVTDADNEQALRAALDNRRERIALNLSGAPASTTHITSADSSFEAAVVYAPATTTPVQFVATDGLRYVVSGVAHLNAAADAPADSLQPVVDVLRRDIAHTLATLRAK